MNFTDIKGVCAGLVEKAERERFLDYPVGSIEKQADEFVERFAIEHGLTAHTLSAYRWYFQSEVSLFEDGFVELICKINPFTRRGHCTFECIDVSGTDMVYKKAVA